MRKSNKTRDIINSKRFYFLVFIAFLGLSNKGYSQYLPAFENFSLSSYKGANQNWDVSRATDGNIYVANSNGLLLYNGTSWKLHQLPNKTIIRSVLASGDFIFTGSFEEFGFWKRDVFGLLKYESLSDKITHQIPPNEEIWQIVSFQDKIIFRSFTNVYIYDFVTLQQLPLGSIVMSAHVVDNALYISTLNDGFFVLSEGRLAPFYDNKLLKDTKIISVIGLKGKWLIFTSLKGSFYLQDNVLTPTGFEIDKTLKLHQLNDVSVLSNGDMVFGTIKDGVFLTDANGGIKFHLSKENGLINNTVLGQFVDDFDYLWLGLDNGIAKVDLSSRNYLFNDITGKLGAVYDVIKYNDTIYIGSNTGLFMLDENESLQFIEGSQGQVWDLKIIEGALFCGHNDGTFLIEGKQMIKVSDFTGGWTIQKVPERNNTYIQGTYTGLIRFTKQSGKWSVKRLGETTIPSRFLVFENPYTAWVAHAYRGLYRVKFDSNYDTINSMKSYADRGINSDFNVRIYNIKNTISFKTNDGWQKYEPILDSIIPYSLLNERFGKDSYIISEDLTQNVLALKNKEGVISFESLSNPEANQILMNKSIKNQYVVGYENISQINDSIDALNLVNGFMMINKKSAQHQRLYPPSIEALAINNRLIHLSNIKANPIILGYNESITIELASPRSTPHFFEYKILDNDENWVAIEGNTIELSNLKEGKYLIELRTADTFDANSVIENLSFQVDPPWYRGSLGIFLYISLSLLTLLLFYYAHKRRLLKHKRYIKLKYQKEQQEILRENALENEKNIVHLKNQALQNELKLKSKQLANNAMAIVKKNESLQDIKQELILNKDTFSNYYTYKKLLKKVDSSIIVKDEWKVFEHNFNQVHEEFFNKIKVKHENLTPKDLKICAYIKMNLSSKEIAPLMNISVRGVETHRYRLKKKLNLDNDNSVVDYLLNIK